MEIQRFFDTASHVVCSSMCVVNVNKARFVYFTLDQQSMPRKAVKKGTKLVLSTEPTKWTRSMPPPPGKCTIYVFLKEWLKSLEIE